MKRMWGWMVEGRGSKTVEETETDRKRRRQKKREGRILAHANPAEEGPGHSSPTCLTSWWLQPRLGELSAAKMAAAAACQQATRRHLLLQRSDVHGSSLPTTAATAGG